MSAEPTKSTFDPQRATELYQAKDYATLSEYFLGVLAGLDNRECVWGEFNAEHSRFVNVFMKHFLYFFSQEDYLLSDEAGALFIQANPLIANLAAMSVFATTDPWLELLRNQSSNFIKILTLLNARCRARFEISSFFATQPKFATLWYTVYFNLFHGGTPTQLLYENARRHVSEVDSRWEYAGPGMSNFYFLPTYFALGQEPGLKKLYHALVKPLMAQAKVKNSPNPKSIAIVTARWVHTSSVYRSLAPYVEALRHDYDLTLVRLENYDGRDNFDKSWFKAIKNISISGNEFQLQEILENNFSLAYYPDIGMQAEDLHLCNARIAPIQVMGYGHPVSTHGSEIDYFMGGQEVELLEDAQKNYSERLVTIPGIGAYSVLPSSVEIPDQDAHSASMILNCPWCAHKCNHPHLLTLERIAKEAGKPVRFRIFCGPFLYQHNTFLAFRHDMISVLGDAVEIVPNQPYSEYQRLLNEGAFSLDSWPFGGFNTIVDSLAIGKPVVALEGHHAINRLAAAVLRRVGMDELVAKTPDEYVAISLKLIDDDAYREDMSGRLAEIDLEAVLCRKEETGGFKRAIDFLIENHERLKAEGSRQPIVIE